MTEQTGTALRGLIASWRGYIKTPDNDYSDGVADGLSEAAGELEDWLNANAAPGMPSYADLLAFARDVAACMPGADDDPSSADQETLSGLGAAAEAMLDGGPYNGSYDTCE